tara:strand:+ start:40 stop:285 length:246 start_codon:yes stop_codon:yes gene_type:complete
LLKVKYYIIERLNIEGIIMWVISRSDPDMELPDLLTDDDGSAIIFNDKISAWRYIELLCKDVNVDVNQFMEDDSINICRLH